MKNEYRDSMINDFVLALEGVIDLHKRMGYSMEHINELLDAALTQVREEHRNDG